jgi:hypothetical protein
VNIVNVYLLFILYSLKCKLEEGKIDRVWFKNLNVKNY